MPKLLMCYDIEWHSIKPELNWNSIDFKFNLHSNLIHLRCVCHTMASTISQWVHCFGSTQNNWLKFFLLSFQQKSPQNWLSPKHWRWQITLGTCARIHTRYASLFAGEWKEGGSQRFIGRTNPSILLKIGEGQTTPTSIPITTMKVNIWRKPSDVKT